MARVSILAALCLSLSASTHASSSSRSLLRGAEVVPPGLPSVTKIMNASSVTLDRMSQQLSELGSRATEAANAQQAQLSQVKEGYEHRLATEQGTNDQMKLQNKQLSAKIWDLEKGNHQLQDKAHGLQKANSQLREALSTVVTKSNAAEGFVNSSLAAADDSHAAYLDVLKSTDSSNAASDDTDTAASDDDASNDATGSDETTSDDSAQPDAQAPGADSSSDDSSSTSDGDAFIEMQAHLHRQRSHHEAPVAALVEATTDDSDQEADQDSSDADDSDDDSNTDTVGDANSTAVDSKSNSLMVSLQKELAQLAQQQAASSKEMDSLFQKRFKKIKDERAKILADQKVLNHTRVSLAGLQKKLKVAVHHLEVTKSKLQGKIQGLGHYLETLAGFVLKPSSEAEQLIPELTNDVSGFIETQSTLSTGIERGVVKKRVHVEVQPEGDN